ncbi:MAG: hypothetical protein M3003_09825 [Candidatus Dormibacteraeota bacterium]|nr:hypothetical protein [Candidatus Dormibacteraeota bacterium]
MNLIGEAIISLIATAGAGIAFLLMLEEAIALRMGKDPMSNNVRAALRRFPRATYAFAVVIGMILGHLVWP